MGLHSVHSPLHRACNSTSFCYPGNSVLPSISSLLYGKEVNEKLLPPHIRAIIQLIFLYNMRVSELLSIMSSDVFNPDRALCLGRKGSNSYIIFIPGLSLLLDRYYEKSKVFNIFPYSYLNIYRWAIKIGVRIHSTKKCNSSVTHISRYHVAKRCANIYSNKVASSVLRHKSEKNILYYLK